MKTFKQFFEATEKDLKAMGANPSQIATLKARAAKRGGTGFGVSGSTGSHFHQKATEPQVRVLLLLDKPTQASSTDATKKGGPSSASTKAADKGRAIVKQKSSAITPSKPGALATQRPNNPGDNSNKMGRTTKTIQVWSK